MKKMFVLITALLLLSSSPLFAAVGLKIDNTPTGTCTDLKFLGTGAVTNDGSTCSMALVLAGVANGGATSMTSTETAVSTSYALVRKAISDTVGQAGTLADGTPGQTVTIFTTTRVGSGTFILSPTTTTGFDSITFDAVAEYATLTFVDSTTGWIMISTNATVTQP